MLQMKANLKISQYCWYKISQVLLTNVITKKRWFFTNLEIYQYKNIKGDNWNEMYSSD